MSPPQHAPELFKDIGIDAAEGLRCDHVAVVIGPAAKRFVQLLDQDRHRRARVLTDQFPNFSFEGEDSLNRRRDVQNPAMLAKGLPQEGESVADIRDHGLLFGKSKAALGKELFQSRFGMSFQQAF